MCEYIYIYILYIIYIYIYIYIYIKSSYLFILHPHSKFTQRSWVDFQTSRFWRLPTFRSLLFFVSYFYKMLVTQRWKLANRTLKEKCAGLEELEKGQLNKDVATEYYVPKNTASAWVENKDKLLPFSEKEKIEKD